MSKAVPYTPLWRQDVDGEMGYSILLQWKFDPPSRAPLTEIILTRILEHYQLQYSSRMTVQFRTFRAQSKTLTVVQYTPQTRETQQARDDIAYLVLDDRSSASSSSSVQPNGDGGNGNGKGKKKDETKVEDEEIQIIEPPTSAVSANGENPTTRPGKRKSHKQYRTIAVRPAGAVVPMLHNLLSPFVLGVTKSARQAASTTAQQAMPTSLPGTQVIVQSYTFPTLTSPNPPINLIIHSMPPNTNSIILEAEYVSPGDEGDDVVWEAVLREFLEGCVPENAGGERKWSVWPKEDEETPGDWEGSERIRRITQMVTTAMREASVV